MTFKLSRRSLDRLEGIDDGLQAVVKMAITLTKTDFGVVQGMRTIEQQKELVAKGASQTMKSKHLEGAVGACVSGGTIPAVSANEVQVPL